MTNGEKILKAAQSKQLSAREIAKSVGVSVGLVYAVLHKNGVKLAGNRKQATESRILAARKTCESVAEIAKAVRKSEIHVRTILNEHGLGYPRKERASKWPGGHFVRYSNRKLYDGREGGYVVLSDVLASYRSDPSTRVVDFDTGADITAATVARAIFEENVDNPAFQNLILKFAG